MNSRHVTYLLPEFVDGTISESERQLVENHLEQCEHCQKELQSIQELYRELKDQSEQKPPDYYWITLLPRIHQRIEEQRTYRAHKWIPRFAFPLAFAALVLFVVIHIFSSRDSGADQQVANGTTTHTEIGVRRVIEEMSNEEIRQLNEASFADNGFSLRDDIENPLTGDKEILETVLVDAENLFSYSEIDVASFTATLDDQEVEQLVTRLNQKRFVR